jgi:uncharacterized protein with HEPN domain
MDKPGRSIEDLLADLVSWGDRIERIARDKSLEDFLADEVLQLALSKCVETIGEASRNILRYHPGFAESHPELDIVEAYRMRNRLAHGYDTIDWRIVWDTATVYVPILVSRVREFLPPCDG